MSEHRPFSRRVRVRRTPHKARYDPAVIRKFIDDAMFCHVGYAIDGQPMVTPTMHWREGDKIYWHGSSASKMLRTVKEAAVCVTVSHLDGLVLARSGMHHSVNYRSVMVLGRANKVDDAAEKERQLKIFIERLFPGRWDSLRPATAQELKATTVMWTTLSEASAKIRTGPPVDDEEDYDFPVWAGEIPLRHSAAAPAPCPRLPQGLRTGADVAEFLAWMNRGG